MNENNETSDAVVIHDRANRRRFMRRGAAFVAAAGVISSGSMRSAMASDCDRGGTGGEKPEHAGNGSDSDSGANADPTGCGRNYDEKPKISRAVPDTEKSVPKRVVVARITV